MGRWLVVPGVLASLLAAGCGNQLSGSEAPTTSLTVRSTVSPAPDGGLYTEGALVEVKLLAPVGLSVGTKRDSPGRPLVFRHLSPGTYTVLPGLRPCDGNCGYLDARTDTCRGTVWVPQNSVVDVRFTISRGCTVNPTAGG